MVVMVEPNLAAASIDEDNPIKTGQVDMRLDEFFLDYQDPIKSVDEWEF